MKLLDVVTSPWAILPDKLLEIQAIYATHLRGEKIDLAGVEARIGKPLKNEHAPFQVVDGVAVIPVAGVLAKRMNLMSAISGGNSTELIARDLRAAAADPEVKGIVLAVDSPGGTVDGTQQLAQLVAQIAADKPVRTWAEGAMASAAYWIGSAAGPGNVFIGSDTTAIGSIGVVATHVDVSRAEEARGVKTTEIVAGRFKRAASQYGPLSESGRATMQAQVDAIYSVFVSDVAAARGVSEDQVLTDMADGRLFIGKEALAAGLVDGVSTLEQVIASLATPSQPSARAGGASARPKKGKTMDVTQDLIATEHPDIAAAFRAEGAASERARILAVEAQMLPGHAELIATLKADGKTTGPEAAAQVLAAERARLTKVGVDLAKDAPAPLAHAAPPAPKAEPEKTDPRGELHRKAKEYQAEHPGTSLLDAINAVAH